jgi:hypothetical protein
LTVKLNSFEGGTSGVGLTHSPTNNTGGASGDQFTTIVLGTGSAITFDTAHAMHGTLAGKLAPAASGAARIDYDNLSTNTLGVALYYYFTANPTDDTYICQFNSSAGRVVSLHLASGGTLKLRDFATASTANIWASTSTIPLNQWVRIEVWAQVGTTTSNGQIKVAYYLGDSTTATGSTSLTAQDLQTTPLTRFSFGKFNASAYATPFWVDDPRYDDTATDLIGPTPAGTPPTVSATSIVTVASGSTATLSATASVTGATLSSLTVAQQTGPTTVTLSGSGTTSPASRTFSTVVPGTYTFLWTATDSNGLTGSAAQTVYVTTTSARPDAVISNPGGYTNVGGASSLQAAVADSSDVTYIESPQAPSGSAITLRLQPQPSGPVTVTPRHQKSDATATITALYELLQGSGGTVIASQSYSVGTSWVDDTPFTTNTTQTGSITDFNNLWVRITATSS